VSEPAGSTGALDRLAAVVVTNVQRAPLLVIVICFVLAGFAAWITARDLGINTSTSDMIAESAPFMRTYQSVKARFPERADIITVVIEADTPDRARDAADRLTAALRGDADLFPYVLQPGGGEFFARNGLLYLDRDELLDLFDALADSSPLLQRLRDDTTMRGLFAVVGLGVDDAAVDRASLDDLDWLLGRMARAIDATLNGAPAQLSWQEIMYGQEATADDRRALILVRPNVLDYDTLLPGGTALSEIRRLAAASGLGPENGITVRLTGGPALQYDELATVQRGLALVGLVSLALITIILWLALRSVRTVAACLVTLVMGLLWTAGFATLAVGHLNLISVAFAVLFVSLVIDFSIHFCLRTREIVAEGVEPRAAVRLAAGSVGGSLGLCALSTAVGFFAFLPTDYRGVSELGVIAGTGMIIGLVANWTLLPALLTVFPVRAGAPPRLPALLRLPMPRRTVRGAAIILGVGSLLLLPGLSFDVNPLNLQDEDAESVRALRTLMAGDGREIWAAASIAENASQVKARAAAFEALPEVDRAVSLPSFVPSDQDERFDIITDIASAIEPDPFATVYKPPDIDDQRAAVAALARSLDRIAAEGPVPDGAAAMSAALARLAEAPADTLSAVDVALVGALPARLVALDRALEAEPFDIENLPGALVARYRSTDGALRLDIYPTEDITADNQALARFVAALRTVDPDVTDDPILVLEAGEVMISAFAQALISALAMIALILYVVTRRMSDVAIILAPLCLAGALTGAAMRLIELEFNFANVIVLPLLLGIGVDSAIHLVHRFRAQPDRKLVETSTVTAVVFSALTTMAGFGSLALSPHPGTASMGLLLLLGVALTVTCSLVLIPALLPRRSDPVEAAA